MKKLVACLMLFAFSFYFAGCATAPSGARTFTPQGRLFAHLGTSIAVGKFCDANPHYTARVAQIAGEIRAMTADGVFSTVDDVMAAVAGKIHLGTLSAEEQAMLRDMLAALTAELKDRIPQAQITSEYLLTVSEIAGWIEDSARARLVPPPAPAG